MTYFTKNHFNRMLEFVNRLQYVEGICSEKLDVGDVD